MFTNHYLPEITPINPFIIHFNNVSLPKYPQLKYNKSKIVVTFSML